MICESADEFRAERVTLYHGTRNEYKIGNGKCDDKNVCIEKFTTPRGRGKLEIKGFNPDIHTGYYKCEIIRHNGEVETCIWHVSLLGKII